MESPSLASSPSVASSASIDEELQAFRASLRDELDLWVGELPTEENDFFQSLIRSELTKNLFTPA